MSNVESGECSVEYLKDSAAIVNGLKFDQSLVDAILNAPQQAFTPLGSRESSAVGEVFLGIKKRGLIFKPNRHLQEIATAETLLRKDPTLRRHLPLFTLGVTDGTEPVGILTEDFTENDKYRLDETPRRVGLLKPRIVELSKIEDLRTKIIEALEGRVDAFSLNRSFGEVCGKLVMFDFDEIADGWSAVQPARSEVEGFEEMAAITLSFSKQDS